VVHFLNSPIVFDNFLNFAVFQVNCKVAFFTAKDAKSAKEMLARDIS